MKKTYITPAIEQEEIVVEAGIAVSAVYIQDIIIGEETQDALEDWDEGHTNWW